MQKFHTTLIFSITLSFFIIIPIQAFCTPIAVGQTSNTTLYVDGYYVTENGSDVWHMVQGAMATFYHDNSYIQNPATNDSIVMYQWCFVDTDSDFDEQILWSGGGSVGWADIPENQIFDNKYLRTSVEQFQTVYTYLNPGTYYANLRILDNNNPPATDTDSITINVIANIVDMPNPVPEPATMFLFGVGLLGFAGVSRKKK